MNTYNRCPSCGNYLAVYVNLVETIKQARLLDIKNSNEETKNADIITFMYSNDNTLKIGDTLDALEVKLICCRIHLIGMTNFNVIFKTA